MFTLQQFKSMQKVIKYIKYYSIVISNNVQQARNTQYYLNKAF